MTTIDIAQLTPEQKKALKAELIAANKVERQKRAEDIITFKKLAEDYVINNIDPLVHHHEITECLIEKLWKDYETIRSLKTEIYGTKTAQQDSHTTTLEDGTASITVGWNVTIGFDGTEQEGVKMIMEVIKELSDDEDDDKKKKLAKIAETFLKPNSKTKMLNPSKIIELSKLKSDFNDERFDRGLDIIFDAQQRRQNSMYVSGWKFVEVKGMPKKLEFRFTV